MTVAKKIEAILDQALTDDEYIWLDRQRKAIEPEIMTLVGKLPEAQRNLLIAYIGLGEEMGLRLLELSVFEL